MAWQQNLLTNSFSAIDVIEPCQSKWYIMNFLLNPIFDKSWGLSLLQAQYFYFFNHVRFMLVCHFLHLSLATTHFAQLLLKCGGQKRIKLESATVTSKQMQECHSFFLSSTPAVQGNRGDSAVSPYYWLFLCSHIVRFLRCCHLC